jgi:hypothetical protein
MNVHRELTIHVSQFTGSNEMSNESGKGKDHAQNGGSNVSPPKERLFTADPGYSRNDDRLGAAK